MNTLLDLLLADEDCARVISALSARASELGVQVEDLIWAMTDFWLKVPRDVDVQSLKVWAAQFAFLLEAGADNVFAPLAAPRPDLPLPLPQRGSRVRRGSWQPALNPGLAGRGPFTTVRQVYDIHAASTFLPQVSGETFTVSLTIHHEKMGQPEESQAVQVVGRLVKELSERVARRPGKNGRLHRITFIDQLPGGHLRSQVLLALPDFLIGPTRRWLFENWLRTRAPDLSEFAPVVMDADCPRTARGRMNRHWDLVRKLWTGVDPEAMVDGRYLFELLGLKRQQLAPAGAISGRRFNLSQTITAKARREQKLLGMPMLSAWEDRAWNALLGGWELAEHRDRVAEADRRTRQIAELEHAFGQASGGLDGIALANRIRAATASWAWDRYDRPRSWDTWWR